jgi:tryptophan 7-halogenase
MDLFRSNGRVFRDGNELFAEPSWVQVMHGQRMVPRGYHALVDAHPLKRPCRSTWRACAG